MTKHIEHKNEEYVVKLARLQKLLVLFLFLIYFSVALIYAGGTTAEAKE